MNKLKFNFLQKQNTSVFPKGYKEKTIKMSTASIISKLEKQLKALKVSTKASKKAEKVSKKLKISEVTKKSDLKKFTVAELKEFIKKKKYVTKKTDKLHKDDWIDLIWKNLDINSSSSESEETDESGESDSSVSSFEELD